MVRAVLAVVFCLLAVNGAAKSLPRQDSGTTPDISTLNKNLRRVESVREIKDLQRSYGQYAQVGLWSDMGALFAADGILQWGQGDTLDDQKAALVTGPAAIATWLEKDAGKMDGKTKGSLHLQINEQGLVSLSDDGKTAKGRWHALRYFGDGAGATKIEGGVFENQYAMGEDGRWKISLLRFYPMYLGNYRDGWKSVMQGLPIVPYHFTPDQAGMPVQKQSFGDPSDTTVTTEELEYRIERLQAEDDVRNLQHSYGYYVDMRMWADVIDLFGDDATFTLDGSINSGSAEIRNALEDWMGPEGLTKGILNERPNFHTMVSISRDGRSATSRGLEFGMIGDANAHTAKWEFSVFHNTFARDAESGLWKLKSLNITRNMVAEYGAGWGNGGQQSTTNLPDMLDRAQRFTSWHPTSPVPPNTTTTADYDDDDDDSKVADLARRLARSAAVDETENVSAAYGYFADDIRCSMFADLHAQKGFKESPGTGWYVTPDRIARACTSRYGSGSGSPSRPNVPFHWRPQPVVLASHDGRSTGLRTRILQSGTSSGSAGGFSGVYGFNGGMYHDQFVLETQPDGSLRRKLWSLSLDEFYWQSASWDGGWAGVRRSGPAVVRDLPEGAKVEQEEEEEEEEEEEVLQRRQTNFPPDVSLKDPQMVEREMGLSGGSGQRQAWPDWAPMWWSYRNPVSGRVPKNYWAPGCVPCRTARPQWALLENGFEEPPTGPTLVEASLGEEGLSVTIIAGPEEPLTGNVEIQDGDGSTLTTMMLGDNGKAYLDLDEIGLVYADMESELVVIYRGSSRLKPGKATVKVDKVM